MASFIITESPSPSKKVPKSPKASSHSQSSSSATSKNLTGAGALKASHKGFVTPSAVASSAAAGSSKASKGHRPESGKAEDYALVFSSPAVAGPAFSVQKLSGNYSLITSLLLLLDLIIIFILS